MDATVRVGGTLIVGRCRGVMSALMTSAELGIVLDVVNGLGEWSVSGLGQWQSQEATNDRQHAEDDERKLTSDESSGVRLGQVVDVRVQDAAETTRE